MKRFLHAVLIALLATLVAAQQHGEQTNGDNGDVRIAASIKAVQPMADFAGSIIPIGSDPRFALTVRIESVNPADPEFRRGSLVTFGIHSPSLLFRGEPELGKIYAFTVTRVIEKGKVKFGDLRLR